MPQICPASLNLFFRSFLFSRKKESRGPANLCELLGVPVSDLTSVADPDPNPDPGPPDSHVFGLLDPDPDPDPSIIKQK